MGRELPKILNIHQKPYPIDTDFRVWMDLQGVFMARDLTSWEKQNIAFYNTLGFGPGMEDYPASA